MTNALTRRRARQAARYTAGGAASYALQQYLDNQQYWNRQARNSARRFNEWRKVAQARKHLRKGKPRQSKRFNPDPMPTTRAARNRNRTIPRRRRYKRKKKVTVRRRARKNSRRLARVERKVNQGLATHTRRTVKVGVQSNLANQCFNHLQVINDKATLAAQFAALRYYDTSLNAFQTHPNPTTANVENSYLFTHIYSTFSLMNNYALPCKVTLYLIEVNGDTSILPTTAITNGALDQGGYNVTSVLSYPTDSNEFKKLFKIVKSKSLVLGPGERFSQSTHIKNVKYSPEFAISHPLNYQKRWKTRFWLTRQQGLQAHEGAGLQGTANNSLDFMHKQTYVIRYDAGKKLTDYSHDVSSLDPPVAGFVQTTAEQEQTAYTV